MKRILVVLSCILPGLGFGAEGLKEINPACVSSGCFSGDAPGFPVEITEPGGYVLTGNLDLRSLPAAEDSTAILVSAARVSIDLNGYSIIGPTVCSGLPLSCTPVGAGFGIHAPLPDTDVLVKNGFIEGMGSDGVSMSGTVIGVVAESNGGVGIGAAVVEASSAIRNGTNGIRASSGRVEDSSARENGGNGIVAFRSVVSRVNAFENEGNGIVCELCNLSDSVSTGNGAFGVDFDGSGNAYGGNVMALNGSGNIFLTPGTVIQTKPNLCASSACPDI